MSLKHTDMSYFKPECLLLISLIQEPFYEGSMREMEGHEGEQGLEENRERVIRVGVCGGGWFAHLHQKKPTIYMYDWK